MVTCVRRLWTLKSMVCLVAGLETVVLSVLTGILLADPLSTHMNVAMQASGSARGPLRGVPGLGPPRGGARLVRVAVGLVPQGLVVAMVGFGFPKLRLMLARRRGVHVVRKP